MRPAVMILFLSLCAAFPCEAADLAGRVLAVHNAERAALDLPLLVWNDALATQAAAWADQLAELGRLEHSPKTEREGEGENLWMGTARHYSPEEMVDGWVQEKRFFRYGAFPMSARRAIGMSWAITPR